VVIVGGSVTGSAVAYALASAGERDVVVLEAEDAYDQHSTGRSAAYYIPMYESAAYAALSKASIDFLRSPPDGFSKTPIFRRDGAVIAAKNGAGAGVEAELKEAKALGMNASQLSAPEIKELVPTARVEMLETAAYYPDAGEIDVPALVAAYRREAIRMGVSFVRGNRYRGARSANGRVTVAMTDHGDIACGAVVNAAGAWVGEVADMSGATHTSPLVLRRHLLKTRVEGVPADARWPFFRCPSAPLYFKLTDGELSFSPMDATPDPIGSCETSAEKVAATIATINAFTTLNVDPAKVTSVAGHRVFGPDHAPLIGADPAMKGFFWAGGMGGCGIMAAPAVGEMVSAALLGKPVQIETAPSAISRLARN
jgi:D-arginine dehydrogenase